ncbi:hypothetical protein CPB83DRAFT_861545 [Crepidotus variabilis]|uniref:Uncharacterized protein n=1 Tax=Crepidotus variabilis TaxID=179855 RepID=A0A9P6E840_9AGAR|nr:hypothetical protein CPB83DRAFT_861545 [Crepidotus variabilis]
MELTRTSNTTPLIFSLTASLAILFLSLTVRTDMFLKTHRPCSQVHNNLYDPAFQCLQDQINCGASNVPVDWRLPMMMMMMIKTHKSRKMNSN